MDDNELKSIQRFMVRRVLGPFQSMIESGQLAPDMALALLGERVGEFSGNDDTPEYRRFKENSGLIYADELFFDISYALNDGILYQFIPASRKYVSILFKLYQHLSGKDYNSPEQLREIMRELLDENRILELGSGPGFNLKILQDLGARVSGVEIRRDLIGRVPDVDVRHGDAEHLDHVFGDEQFDIVYSNDFFCTAVMDQEKSGKIAAQTYRHTMGGGTGIHRISYKRMELPFYLLGSWISERQTGRDPRAFEQYFWGLSEEEREKSLYTNRCSLDPQDLAVPGFKIKEYSIENGELDIIARK